MKTNYIKPAIEIVKIETNGLLAASGEKLNVRPGTSGPSQAESRKYMEGGNNNQWQWE